MAQINCPICNKEIPENADTCIRCGYKIKSTQQTIVDETTNPTQIPKPKRKKKIIISIIALILVTLIAIGIIMSSKYNREYEYYCDLYDMTYTMISSAADAEDCGNLIVSVWHNSIWNVYDDETDEFTIENGVFLSDFNDALDNLFSDETFCTKASSIYSSQLEVMNYMTELSDPPEQYEIAYDVLRETYDLYIEFTDMVINPIGSYNSYSEDFSETDTELAKKISELELYIDY